MNLVEHEVTQGAIFSAEKLSESFKNTILDSRCVQASRSKELTPKCAPARSLLVLTQDCDIYNPNKKNIEVVALKPRERIQPRVSRNQNYSTLQLVNNGQCWHIESDLISVIPKTDLCEEINQELTSISDNLSKENLTKVIGWRVGCYDRRPFPHKFNQEFYHGYLKQEGNALGRFFDEHSEDIIDIYLHVDPMDDEDANQYIVVFNAVIFKKGTNEQEVSDEENFIEQFERVLKPALTELHHDNNSLIFPQISDEAYSQDGVRLDLIIPEDDFTLYDARNVTCFNLEYFCYDDEE